MRELREQLDKMYRILWRIEARKILGWRRRLVRRIDVLKSQQKPIMVDIPYTGKMPLYPPSQSAKDLKP